MRTSLFIVISLVAGTFSENITVVLPVCCGYGNRTSEWSDNFTISYNECDETVGDPNSIFKSDWKGRAVEWNFSSAAIKCGKYYGVPEDKLRIEDDGSLSQVCVGRSCCGNPLPQRYRVTDWEENFAFCMDYSNGTINAQFCLGEPAMEITSQLQKICIIISSVLLAVTCVVNLTDKSVRKESYVPYLVSQSVSLAVAFVCLARIQFYPEVENCWECLLAGYGLQYFFLAAFFWMNAKCISVYIDMSRLQQPRFNNPVIAKLRWLRFRRFSLYAWGVPLLITSATYSIQMSGIVKDPRMRPDVGTRTCFFQSPLVKWIYFYGPMSVLIAANLILFALTATTIVKKRKNIFPKTVGHRRYKSRLQKEIWFFNQYTKLFTVNGLCWVGEVLEVMFNSEEDSWQQNVGYAIDVLNCLQGVFIFYFFVCQKEVLVKKLLCISGDPESPNPAGLLCCCLTERKTSVTRSPNATEISMQTTEEFSFFVPNRSNRSLSTVFNKSNESVTFGSVESDDDVEMEPTSDSKYE